LKGQPLRRRGRSGQITISSRQSLAEALWRSLAEPDFHKGPDDYAHHIVHEVIGANPEFKLPFT
jgi:hypothetical protein